MPTLTYDSIEKLKLNGITRFRINHHSIDAQVKKMKLRLLSNIMMLLCIRVQECGIK